MKKHTQSELQAVHDVGAVRAADDVPKERGQFRALVVGNPNYFGTLPASPFRVVQLHATPPTVAQGSGPPQDNRLARLFVTSRSLRRRICSADPPSTCVLPLARTARRDRSGRHELRRLRRTRRCTGGRRWSTPSACPASAAQVVPIPNVLLVRAIPVLCSRYRPDTPHVPGGATFQPHIRRSAWIIKGSSCSRWPASSPQRCRSSACRRWSRRLRRPLGVADCSTVREQDVEPHRFALAEIRS